MEISFKGLHLNFNPHSLIFKLRIVFKSSYVVNRVIYKLIIKNTIRKIGLLIKNYIHPGKIYVIFQ